MADRDALAARVTELVAERGPQTGAQLHEALDADLFALWKACALASGLELRRVGRRYVRLDRTIEGFARLSPSILREFFTYTVVGVTGDPRIEDAVRYLSARTEVISRNKLRLARRLVAEAIDPLVASGTADPHDFCVLLAGDIVYGMGHDVVRRETSTGTRVDGSDLDLIVLVADAAADRLSGPLDEALLSRKWFYLKHPAFHEELDYVVKPFSRLVEQARFDTFTSMVACKVFDEGQLLFGDQELHEQGRALLERSGAVRRLRQLESEAASQRDERVRYLLALPDDALPEQDQVIFYSDDERAEFEH